MRRSRQFSRTSRLNIGVNSYSYPDDVVSAAILVMQGKNFQLYSLSKIEAVCGYLTTFKDDVIRSGDYFYAQTIEDKINELKNFHTKATYERQQGINYDSLFQKMKDAQMQLNDAQTNKRNFLKQFNEQKQIAVNNLMHNQEEDMKQFEKDIEKKKVKYSKYSGEYLNNMRKKNCLVQSRMYLDAYYITKETNAKKEAEDIQNQTNWNNFVEQKRDTLLKHQKAQMDCLLEKFEINLNASLKYLDEEINKWKTTLETIKRRMIDTESHISPETRRRTKRILISVPEHNFSAKMTKMRTSNYNSKRENIKVLSSRRPRTALY